jgi:hypothetical protein
MSESNDDKAWEGVVVCFHTVPQEVSPEIVFFWEEVSKLLARQRILLVVATSTELQCDNIAVINMPYNITEFRRPHSLEEDVVDSLSKDQSLLEALKEFYLCDDFTAIQSINAYSEFYDDLIDTLSPSVIVGWQSSDLSSFFLRKIANLKNIPLWNCERGLLKGTLMLDLGDNYTASELVRSVTINSLYKNYMCNESLYEELRIFYSSSTSSGKYESRPFMERDLFREKYNIPHGSKVLSIFMHGMFGFNTKLSGSVFDDLNNSSFDQIQGRINKIVTCCVAQKVYVLFQDHPLNQFHKEKIKLPFSEYIIRTSENIHSLLRASDCFVFSASTIQYEAVFYEKPIGLISSSILQVQNSPYDYETFESAEAFLHCLFANDKWGEHLTVLKKRICFIYEHFLIKLDENNRVSEADRIAGIFSCHKTPVSHSFFDKVDWFLKKWGS